MLVKGIGKNVKALVLMFEAFKYMNSTTQMNEYLRNVFKDSIFSNVSIIPINFENKLEVQ